MEKSFKKFGLRTWLNFGRLVEQPEVDEPETENRNDAAEFENVLPDQFENNEFDAASSPMRNID